MAKVDCIRAVKGAVKDGELSNEKAEQLLARVQRIADIRIRKNGGNIEKALRDIAGELKMEDKLMRAVDKRNRLLSIAADRRLQEFSSRFSDLGEGARAFLVGSSKTRKGARLSVDFQARALNGKYFGRLVAELEDAGVFSEFKKGEHAKDIYIEMGELNVEGGRPGRTGNDAAAKIAKIVEGVTSDMVAQQNRAGAYIKRNPGYVVRQLHDRDAIRRAGTGPGFGKESKEASFKVWSEFVAPLLDEEKTFEGHDPKLFLRKVHEALYTGIHGAESGEADVDTFSIHGSMAKKASGARVLHFKDAESAFNYNEMFGVKHFRDAVTSDIHFRSRSIALMENLGPNPEENFRRSVMSMQEKARERDDAAKQVDSLKDWRVDAALNAVTGRVDISSNPGLSRNLQTVRAVAQLSKMGSTVLSAFGDKAFLQAEMAYQGMDHLSTMAAQITGMLPRSEEGQRSLRLMGVAMEGLLGNVASRYSMHDTVHGWAHRAQRSFFDLNMLNWWTDANKATAGELMAAHLGEHSHMGFDALPPALQKVLNMYEIGTREWDLMRKSVWDHEGSKFVTADKLSTLADSDIDSLVVSRGLKPGEANRLRQRDRLEAQLRTYFADRIDIAVPTPGAAERVYTTMNQQAGSLPGEAIRLIMLFKSFPITVLNKIVGREVYGNGYDSVGQWLLHDHKGKFNLAQLVAMTMVGGYISGAIRDALKGRTPKRLVDDGQLNWHVINDAMMRGGGLGIMGDMLFTEYDRQYRSFTGIAAGPVIGQLDPLFALRSSKEPARDAGKLLLDNTPYINLFYIRPVLDYFVLWNLQEMMSPGSLRRQERSVEQKNHQEHFILPSEHVK